MLLLPQPSGVARARAHRTVGRAPHRPDTRPAPRGQDRPAGSPAHRRRSLVVGIAGQASTRVWAPVWYRATRVAHAAGAGSRSFASADATVRAPNSLGSRPPEAHPPPRVKATAAVNHCRDHRPFQPLGRARDTRYLLGRLRERSSRCTGSRCRTSAVWPTSPRRHRRPRSSIHSSRSSFSWMSPRPLTAGPRNT